MYSSSDRETGWRSMGGRLQLLIVHVANLQYGVETIAYRFAIASTLQNYKTSQQYAVSVQYKYRANV